MVDLPYITWCLKNVKGFTLNKPEQALYDTSWKYHVGGYGYNLTTDEEYDIPGDMWSIPLIHWEKREAGL